LKAELETLSIELKCEGSKFQADDAETAMSDGLARRFVLEKQYVEQYA